MAVPWRRAWLVIFAAGACIPEYEVYSTDRCDADEDCGAFSLCEDGICRSCDFVYDRCEAVCTTGWEIVDERRGDCRLCTCLLGAATGGGTAVDPASGGGGTAGYAGMSGAASGGVALASGGVALGGAGVAAGTGAMAGCGTHSECPLGAWCHDSQCAPCSDDALSACEPCSDPLESVVVMVNECLLCDCLPPNECWDDSDCVAGLCVMGRICDDGCTTPACCFGNVCASP